MLLILLLLVSSTAVLGQELFFGSCPVVTPVQDFDPRRFEGEWFEVKKYRFVINVGRGCNTVEYKLNEAGDTFMISFKSVDVLGRVNTVDATAEIKDPDDNKGVLTLTLPGATRTSTATFDYYILATDYDNYAVVFSCRTYVSLFNFQNLWILTRSKTPNYESVAVANLHVLAQELNVFRLRLTNQVQCPVM